MISHESDLLSSYVKIAVNTVIGLPLYLKIVFFLRIQYIVDNMYAHYNSCRSLIFESRACSNHVRLCNSNGENAYKKHSCRYNVWDWQFMLAECMLKSFWQPSYISWQFCWVNYIGWQVMQLSYIVLVLTSTTAQSNRALPYPHECLHHHPLNQIPHPTPLSLETAHLSLTRTQNNFQISCLIGQNLAHEKPRSAKVQVTRYLFHPFFPCLTTMPISQHPHE